MYILYYSKFSGVKWKKMCEEKTRERESQILRHGTLSRQSISFRPFLRPSLIPSYSVTPVAWHLHCRYSIIQYTKIILEQAKVLFSKHSHPVLRIRSDIDRIRIRIQPLRTNRIRIRIQPLRTNRIRIRIRIQTPLSWKFSIYFMMSFNRKLLSSSIFDGP